MVDGGTGIAEAAEPRGRRVVISPGRGHWELYSMASDEFGFRIPQGDLRDLCVSATSAMPGPPYTIEANPSCG